MSKQINFFLLLAVITVFAACNNANKPTETVKEQAQEAPSMNAKELAMSDVQEKKAMSQDMNEKTTMASEKVSNKSAKKVSNSSGMQDLSSATTGDKANTGAPMTDADRLRQMAAAQQRNGQNAGTNLIDSAPAPEKVAMENAKKAERGTIKNTKVSTPTVSTPTAEAAKEMMGAPDHSDWNALLSANVTNTGKVNYKGFKNAQGKLNAYLDKLRNNAPAADWSRNEKMAFWINAYNAFTVKKIVDNYPLGSIQELSGGKVWDDKWINIGDKTYSLNEIENGILRPIYKDARIHFAVNCAAKSCPSLHNRAFTAGNLESKLAQLTKKFVNNADFNTITAGKVTVSKIFDWYSADFGDLKEFLNEYSNTAINADATVDYTEYNWSLNE